MGSYKILNDQVDDLDHAHAVDTWPILDQNFFSAVKEIFLVNSNGWWWGSTTATHLPVGGTRSSRVVLHLLTTTVSHSGLFSTALYLVHVEIPGAIPPQGVVSKQHYTHP